MRFLVVSSSAVMLAGWWFLTRTDSERPSKGHIESDPPDSALGTLDERGSPPSSPQRDFEDRMRQGQPSSVRLAAIRSMRDQSWAKSDNVTLCHALARDPEAEVRAAALETALLLAKRESREAMGTVLLLGLTSPHKDTVHESIYQCRLDPNPATTNILLELARNGSPSRSQAIAALAYSDDEKAQRRVLEVAKDANALKTERIRAIALLSVLKLPEAAEYLAQLVGGADAELREVAVKAMDATGRR